MKKIVAALDIKNGKVVKSIKFKGTKEVGDDPVAFAGKYCADGADEIAVLDIMASIDGRKTKLEIIRQIKEVIDVPLVAVGGIRDLADIKDVLNAGASKVGINSAAIKDKNIIKDAALAFGSEKIVLAIDTKRNNAGRYTIYAKGGIGGEDTGIDLIDWVRQAEQLGAGELLPTSMDTDGVAGGYDIELYKLICDAVRIPVTASGGCGKREDFADLFRQTPVSGALAASVFHYGLINIGELKAYLRESK